MKHSTRIGTTLALMLALGLAAAFHPELAAAKDACRVGCAAEQKQCRAAFRAAFQQDKSACTGSGKTKRQCVSAARSVFRAALKGCTQASSACGSCCKTGGTGCDIRCGDGIVSAGEACDPPGRGGCAGDGVCATDCRCPLPTTTTLETTTSSLPATTTSSLVDASTTTTTSASTTSATATSTTTTTTTTSSTTTTLRSGCFADTGDGTIWDTCTGLQWEKKSEASGLHNWFATYTWAGCCNGDCSNVANLCQPNAAAAATCAAHAAGGTAGCSVCASGTCNVNPNNTPTVATTVWDWLNQLNAAHYAGHDDWRLPSEQGRNTNSPAPAELETIKTGVCTTGPYADPACVNALFGPTIAFYHWSATSHVNAPGPIGAWLVPFHDEVVSFDHKYFGQYYARAVRSCPRNYCLPGECGPNVDGGCGGTIDCGECGGVACDAQAPCSFGLACAARGTCGERFRGACSSDVDCGEGQCSCTEGVICAGNVCHCDAAGGRCLASLDAACTQDDDCAAGMVCSSTLHVCKYGPGAACSPVCASGGNATYPDPLGCTGSDWIDTQCDDRHCFKNALDPAAPLQVGTPVCCLGLGEQCQDDAECCKGNLGVQGIDLRIRRCIDDGTNTNTKVCKRKSLVGEACTTNDDCFTEYGNQCQGNVCVSTTVTHLRQGATCTPGDMTSLCDVDPVTGTPLLCTDCSVDHHGYRCIPATNGCCNNGARDTLDCGDSLSTCCNWQCVNVLIDQANCGACGQSCALDAFTAMCHVPGRCNDGQCQTTDKCPGAVCVPDGTSGCDTSDPSGACCYRPATPALFQNANQVGAFAGLVVKPGCWDNGDCGSGEVCYKDCTAGISSSLWISSCKEQGVCVPQ